MLQTKKNKEKKTKLKKERKEKRRDSKEFFSPRMKGIDLKPPLLVFLASLPFSSAMFGTSRGVLGLPN